MSRRHLTLLYASIITFKLACDDFLLYALKIVSLRRTVTLDKFKDFMIKETAIKTLVL